MNLTDLIEFNYSQKKIILSHSEEELEYLTRWLNSEIINFQEPEALKNSLKELIETCNCCDDVIERKPGYGSGDNGVMIVLNAPGFMALNERESLRKQSIELMKKIIEVINLDLSECYITNLVKCVTSEIKPKPVDKINPCENIFRKEISFIKPFIIIFMGEISSLQGIIRENPGTSWFNIDHPMTLIKNTELKKPAWNTLKLVINKIDENR